MLFRSAFSNCDSLSELVMPDTIRDIGYGAFNYCSSLQTINLPESLRSIQAHTFRGCSSLEQISIPTSVQHIYDYAFDGCDRLTSIAFVGHAPSFASQYYGITQPNQFYGVTATVYYPGEDETWTEDVLQDYGGALNWIPVEGEDGHVLKLANQSEATCTEDGYTGDIICDMCGKVVTPGEVIPARSEERL